MSQSTIDGSFSDVIRKKNLFSPDVFIGIWIVVFVLSMLPNLNNAFPYKGDESYYTVSAMNMIQRGEPLAPYYFGAYRFNKPIVTYLFIRTAYAIFGVSMWSARLLVLIVSCLTLLLTYRLGILIFNNKQKAILAACILGACYLYIGFARIAMNEPFLTLFTLCALYAYVSLFNVKESSIRWGTVGAFFSSCAFMTKGPVGLFPFFSAIIYAFFIDKKNRKKLLWEIAHPLNIAVMALVIAPWYLYIHAVYPTELSDNLKSEAGILHVFHPLKLLTRLFFYPIALIIVHAPLSIVALYLLIKKRTIEIRLIAYLLLFAGLYLTVFIFFIGMYKERYLTIISPAVSIIFASIIFSGTWKKWVTIACITALIQIYLYNAYPFFSAEALRTLVYSWQKHHPGTLGLPIDMKRNGWCRLYAHDRNITSPKVADYLIIDYRDSTNYSDWKIIQTEKRLTSLDFKGGTPNLRYETFHLIKRPVHQ